MDMEQAADPFQQIPVGVKFRAKKCYQIGRRPLEIAFEVEVLDQQHGNHCCPYLDIKGIFNASQLQ